MQLIECPWCGPREETEFHYGGEAHVVYPEDPQALTDEEWGRFVRDGEQSISREHMLWLARREPGLAPDDK